jgi:hypothetical protein
MNGTEAVEAKRLTDSLRLATLTQQVAVAATKRGLGSPLSGYDIEALRWVIGVLSYVLVPIPTGPRELAMHTLVAEAGTEEILLAAAERPGDDARSSLQAMLEAARRAADEQPHTDSDTEALAQLRELFLRVGRSHLHRVHSDSIDRSKRMPWTGVESI